MTCQTCGRPAENGTPTHYIGCEAAWPNEPVPEVSMSGPEHCLFGVCTEPKREAKGKGPKPKYCEVHSDPKNRK